jgi:hypothetical protein
MEGGRHDPSRGRIPALVCGTYGQPRELLVKTARPPDRHFGRGTIRVLLRYKEYCPQKTTREVETSCDAALPTSGTELRSATRVDTEHNDTAFAEIQTGSRLVKHSFAETFKTKTRKSARHQRLTEMFLVTIRARTMNTAQRGLKSSSHKPLCT